MKAGQAVIESYIKRVGAMKVPAANGATVALLLNRRLVRKKGFEPSRGCPH